MTILVLLATGEASYAAIDAAKDGPIYGDPEGLARIEKLEKQLHAMNIRKDHPRIFINAENIEQIRQQALSKYNAFGAYDQVLQLAENKDLVNLAFLYLILQNKNPQGAAKCARDAIKILLEYDPLAGDKRFVDTEVAKMALAFDWAYNAMTDEERSRIAEKLYVLAKIDERAKAIKGGQKAAGEVFHREEWAFNSYGAWPEIALAHHVPDADLCYLSRWNYEWIYGDAARLYAYAADGTPFEGYYYGADGIEWFLALRSATGINLIDGEFGWCKGSAYHVLYRMDLDRKREILHHGVALGAAGCVSYAEGTVAWKIREHLGRTFPAASENPYVKWIMNNEIGISSWILTTVGFGGLDELKAIADILFSDPSVREADLKKADYEDIPLAKLFPGGNEAYMRTGWFKRPVCVGFRSSPAYTKTSHGDFDVNTFVIYKDGVISPDSGVYDAYAGQGNYFSYQKNTTAHNNLIVIDPRSPDGPIKLSNAVDPGGIERVFTRSFGAPSRFGKEDVFLHNPQANWADIIDFKTTPEYDYVIGDAAKAYSSRLNEFIRSLVVIRKNNSAYVIVFDRVDAKSPDFIKKSLIHLVTEPKIDGRMVLAKVKAHYEVFDAGFFESENAFGTSKLFCKVLLPRNRTISKIGGEGYEYYIEGTRPRNIPVADSELKRIEEQMGGVWQEAGTWRVEIIPEEKQKRDYFLQVMYVTDIGDTFNPDNATLKEDGDRFVVDIKDDVLGNVEAAFTKTGKPQIDVELKKEN